MSKIETPKLSLADDVNYVYSSEEGPLWEAKNWCMALRREAVRAQREMQTATGGSVLDVERSAPQLQLAALIKMACPDEEARLEFEECYLSAMIEAIEQATTQAVRAKLLEGVNQQQIQQLMQPGGGHG